MKLVMFNPIKNKVLYFILALITHPLFLSLIVTIIYSMLFIYFFADTILCQGLDELTSLFKVPEQVNMGDPTSQAIQERLRTLERIGLSDLEELKKARSNYIRTFNWYIEAFTRPERDNGLQHLIGHGMDYYLDETKRCLSKFRLTEAMIKTLNPSYVSHIPKQPFE